MRSSHLLTLPALALATPFDLKSRQNNVNSSGITWGKCHDPLIPGNSSLQCGSLDVPLDYTNEDSGATLALEIVRAPTPKVPSKGSIFFNAGGPGASGIEDLVALASRIQFTTNYDYDIVNIVPRGTNSTLPFSCYQDTASSTYAGLTLAASAYDTAPANIWVQSQLFADNCAAMQTENGTLIGTAFTARDLMRVVDVLEEDGLLRYWAPSYGTLLGATVAAMFPDKIDKMVLDGVVNPTLYYRNNESETFTSIDGTFNGFCVGCAENPDKCPLAMNQTADEVKQGIFKMLEGLRTDPLAIPTPGGPLGGIVLDYSFVKNLIGSSLYYPSKWSGMASQLFAVQQRNLTLISEILSAGAAGGGDATGSNALQTAVAPDSNARDGIKCSDVLTHAANRSEFQSALDARHAAGYFADAADDLPTRCAQWKLPAKERYDGDFKVKTTKPILLINNEFDPATPLVSAKNVSETFENAVLVEQRGGYGHTIWAHVSPCTVQHIATYFANGTVPEKGAICDVTVPLLSGLTGWEEILGA